MILLAIISHRVGNVSRVGDVGVVSLERMCERIMSSQKTKELTAILDGETSQHSHLESGTVPS